jgi:hypothetical protein
MGNLQELKQILLSKNLLGGTLPAEFAFLVNLTEISLDGNSFTGE